MTDKPVKEGILQVGVKDEFLDTTKVTQTDGTTAHREVVVDGDPIHVERVVHLESYPFGVGERYAKPVTGQELKELCSLVHDLLRETKVTHLYLSRLIQGTTYSQNDLER